MNVYVNYNQRLRNITFRGALFPGAIYGIENVARSMGSHSPFIDYIYCTQKPRYCIQTNYTAIARNDRLLLGNHFSIRNFIIHRAFDITKYILQ